MGGRDISRSVLTLVYLGHTGVGKTFLLSLYSELLNLSHLPVLDVAVCAWIKDSILEHVSIAAGDATEPIRKELFDAYMQRREAARQAAAEERAVRQALLPERDRTPARAYVSDLPALWAQDQRVRIFCCFVVCPVSVILSLIASVFYIIVGAEATA